MSDTKKLTRVARIILTALENEGKPMKPESLVQNLGMKLRSVRYGLKLLVDQGLVTKYPDLQDLRSFYYSPISNGTSHSIAQLAEA